MKERMACLLILIKTNKDMNIKSHNKESSLLSHPVSHTVPYSLHKPTATSVVSLHFTITLPQTQRQYSLSLSLSLSLSKLFSFTLSCIVQSKRCWRDKCVRACNQKRSSFIIPVSQAQRENKNLKRKEKKRKCVTCDSENHKREYYALLRFAPQLNRDLHRITNHHHIFLKTKGGEIHLLTHSLMFIH